SAVIGVVAQRLIRKLCSECKEAYVPSAEIKDMFCAEGFLVEDISLMKPVGCESCLQTGYSGRTAIYEMINITEDIRQIILKNPSERNINELAGRQGTKSLRQSGLQRVLDQITSLEEVLNITIMDEQ
ncbi:Type IV fimbrial assembly, ATPase PilB, partial [hydrothermal vent metagenome]